MLANNLKGVCPVKCHGAEGPCQQCSGTYVHLAPDSAARICSSCGEVRPWPPPKKFRPTIHLRQFKTDGGNAQEMFLIDCNGEPRRDRSAVLWPGELTWAIYAHGDGSCGHDFDRAQTWVLWGI